MIGYHYTSYENFLKIKKEGLVPQKVVHHDLDLKEFCGITNGEIYGIWVWEERSGGKSHFVSLISNIVKHETERVVLLKVKFDYNDILRTTKGERLEIEHSSSLDDFIGHQDKRATIVTKKIPTENIGLVKKYDFSKFFRN